MVRVKRKIRIAINLITLNEGSSEDRVTTVKDAILSALWADRVIVVDGGSNDDTHALVEECDGPEGRVIRYDKKWENHFGDQRQEALGITPDNFDWVVRVDADEICGPGFSTLRATLAKLPPDIWAVRLRQTNLYPDAEHYAANLGGWETWPRIFRRNLPGGNKIVWVGQVHESPKVQGPNGTQDIPAERIMDWSAQMIHFGWLSRARREEREDLYATIPGSGITGRGDLTNRDFVVRDTPVDVWPLLDGYREG